MYFFQYSLFKNYNSLMSEINSPSNYIKFLISTLNDPQYYKGNTKKKK